MITFSYSLALSLLLNFDWLVYLVGCINVSNTLITTEEVILCIIIGNVHQFIGHYLFCTTKTQIHASITKFKFVKIFYLKEIEEKK